MSMKGRHHKTTGRRDRTAQNDVGHVPAVDDGLELGHRFFIPYDVLEDLGAVLLDPGLRRHRARCGLVLGGRGFIRAAQRAGASGATGELRERVDGVAR